MTNVRLVDRIRGPHVSFAVPRDREYHSFIRRVEIDGLAQREPLLINDEVNPLGQLQRLALLGMIHLTQRIHPWACRVHNLAGTYLIGSAAEQIGHFYTHNGSLVIYKFRHLRVIHRLGSPRHRFLQHLDR
ncbi:hypothetical protein D3C73_801970 [compost metagenome]